MTVRDMSRVGVKVRAAVQCVITAIEIRGSCQRRSAAGGSTCSRSRSRVGVGVGVGTLVEVGVAFGVRG